MCGTLPPLRRLRELRNIPRLNLAARSGIIAEIIEIRSGTDGRSGGAMEPITQRINVVTGHYGSGKTSLSINLALHAAGTGR